MIDRRFFDFIILFSNNIQLTFDKSISGPLEKIISSYYHYFGYEVYEDSKNRTAFRTKARIKVVAQDSNTDDNVITFSKRSWFGFLRKVETSLDSKSMTIIYAENFKPICFLVGEYSPKLLGRHLINCLAMINPKKRPKPLQFALRFASLVFGHRIWLWRFIQWFLPSVEVRFITGSNQGLVSELARRGWRGAVVISGDLASDSIVFLLTGSNGLNRVLKVFRTDDIKMWDNEIRAQQMLNEYSNCDVMAPQILESAQMAGFNYILFEHCEGFNPKVFPKFLRAGKVFKTVCGLAAMSYQSRTMPKAGRLESLLHIVLEGLDRLGLADSINILPLAADSIDETLLCHGFTHGDLNENNLLCSKTQIFVIDWSDFSPERFWWYDFVNFYVTSASESDFITNERSGELLVSAQLKNKLVDVFDSLGCPVDDEQLEKIMRLYILERLVFDLSRERFVADNSLDDSYGFQSPVIHFLL